MTVRSVLGNGGKHQWIAAKFIVRNSSLRSIKIMAFVKMKTKNDVFSICALLEKKLREVKVSILIDHYTEWI